MKPRFPTSVIRSHTIDELLTDEDGNTINVTFDLQLEIDPEDRSVGLFGNQYDLSFVKLTRVVYLDRNNCFIDADNSPEDAPNDKFNAFLRRKIDRHLEENEADIVEEITSEYDPD